MSEQQRAVFYAEAQSFSSAIGALQYCNAKKLVDGSEYKDAFYRMARLMRPLRDSDDKDKQQAAADAFDAYAESRKAGTFTPVYVNNTKLVEAKPSKMENAAACTTMKTTIATAVKTFLKGKPVSPTGPSWTKDE